MEELVYLLYMGDREDIKWNNERTQRVPMSASWEDGCGICVKLDALYRRT